MLTFLTCRDYYAALHFYRIAGFLPRCDLATLTIWPGWEV